MKVGFKVLDCELDRGGAGQCSVDFEQNQILQQNHYRQNFKPCSKIYWNLSKLLASILPVVFQ